MRLMGSRRISRDADSESRCGFEVSAFSHTPKRKKKEQKLFFQFSPQFFSLRKADTYPQPTSLANLGSAALIGSVVSPTRTCLVVLLWAPRTPRFFSVPIDVEWSGSRSPPSLSHRFFGGPSSPSYDPSRAPALAEKARSVSVERKLNSFCKRMII